MTADPRPQNNRVRLALYAAINKAKEDRGLDNELYRPLLKSLTGHDSLKEMTIPHLEKVKKYFKEELGWQEDARYSRKPKSGSQEALIRNLWKDLQTVGALHTDEPEKALRVFVTRQLRLPDNTVSDIRFLTAPQKNNIIEALKAWLVRAKKGQVNEAG